MIIAPEVFELSLAERNSHLWQRLAKHLEGRLQKLRTENDTDLTESRTAQLRGRIAEIKALMALGNEPIELDQESAWPTTR